MCVAAVIFKPVSLQYLQHMENDNPHGAGVAWQSGDQIQFHKGLKAAEIHAMQETGTMTYPYLLHFRWATHGGRVPELTHPFPTGVRALMGEIAGSAPEVVIHNGTWSGYDDAALEHVPAELRELITDTSDTAIAAFIAAYNPTILDEVPWATAHAFIVQIDDKPKMEITTRGTWSEHQDNWYSNLNWLPSNKNYSFYRRGDDWEWDGYRSNSNPYRMPPAIVDTGVKSPPDRASEFSWDEYIRAKYGDETAEELNKLMAEEDEAKTDAAKDDAELAECALEWSDDGHLIVRHVNKPKSEIDWSDVVSEDGGTVNKYLAEQASQNG